MAAEACWARTCPVCKTRYTWIKGGVSGDPGCPRCNPAPGRQALRDGAKLRIATGSAVEPDADAVEALEIIDHIKSMIEDLPARALEFGESVQEKCESIAEWIEKHGSVTAGQMTALRNMASGVERWLK